jgi:hypothetical protein
LEQFLDKFSIFAWACLWLHSSSHLPRSTYKCWIPHPSFCVRWGICSLFYWAVLEKILHRSTIDITGNTGFVHCTCFLNSSLWLWTLFNINLIFVFSIEQSKWLCRFLEIIKNYMPIELCKISEMQEKGILQPENICKTEGKSPWRRGFIAGSSHSVFFIKSHLQ